VPVIVPREYEQDWLKASLTIEDVKALCAPILDAKMEAWPISKMITDRGVKYKNVPEIQKQYEH
jgi:putative SOS response-associated peptidase YedK